MACCSLRLWWLEQHEGAPTQTQLAEPAGTDVMMTGQVLRKLERGAYSLAAVTQLATLIKDNP